MKLAGFLMLVAGWGIALAAMPLLSSRTPRLVFVLAGVGVEIIGLVLLGHAHLLAEGK